MSSFFGGFLALAGGTLTGALAFSGTTHAGLVLNNLTTAQRDALVSPATGSLIANTTTAKPNYYDGTNWLEVPAYLSGTLTTSNPFTLTQTWNAGGVTFNSLLISITKTANAAASTFATFVTAGSSFRAFNIVNDGSWKSIGDERGSGLPYLTMLSTGGTPGLLTNAWITINGDAGDPVPVAIAGESTYKLGVSSDVNASTIIVKTTATYPFLRGYNSSNAKKLDILETGIDLFNTFTDASNFEKAIFSWASNRLSVGTAAAGTGTGRPLDLKGTSISIKAQDGVTTTWNFLNGGHFTADTDSAFDIGATGANRPRDFFLGRSFAIEATVTAGGTTGNQTINKAAGTVNFAAAATALTVTNSLVTANSLIFCDLRTNDATARIANVVPGSGTFTINLTAAATAETSCGFFVVQPD